jgi:opacity protein-like surface antigen
MLEVGIQLFAPIYTGSDDLGIGVGGRARAAWHLPIGLRPELEVGYSAQNVAEQQEALTLLQMGVGVRYGLPRFGRLQPLIGGGLTLDYWSRSIVPGEQPEMPEMPSGPFGFPQTRDDTVWTPGFYGLAGVAFELQPWLLLDLGLRLDFSFHRNIFASDSRRVFERSQLYGSPWIGLAYFH